MLQTGGGREGGKVFILHIVPCLFDENCNIRGHSRKFANWTIHLILFCLDTQTYCLKSVQQSSNRSRYNSCITGNVIKILSPRRSNLLLSMIHEAFLITILPTNSSKIRHCRNTRDKIWQSTHIQDIWKRKVDYEFTIETLPPLWAVSRKLNWPYNYFINLKLRRFPIIVISHLVDKELPLVI